MKRQFMLGVAALALTMGLSACQRGDAPKADATKATTATPADTAAATTISAGAAATPVIPRPAKVELREGRFVSFVDVEPAGPRLRFARGLEHVGFDARAVIGEALRVGQRAGEAADERLIEQILVVAARCRAAVHGALAAPIEPAPAPHPQSSRCVG